MILNARRTIPESTIIQTLADTISSLPTLTNDTRDFGENLAKRLRALIDTTTTVRPTDDDKIVLQRLVKQSVFKLFPDIVYESETDTYSLHPTAQITLVEFLSKLPTNNKQLATLINGDQDDLTTDLTVFIYSKIGRAPENAKLGVTKDFFSECSIN